MNKMIGSVLFIMLLTISPAKANLFEMCQTEKQFIQIIKETQNGKIDQIITYNGDKAKIAFLVTGGTINEKTPNRLPETFIIVKATSMTDPTNYGYIATMYNSKKCAVSYTPMEESKVLWLIKKMENIK